MPSDIQIDWSDSSRTNREISVVQERQKQWLMRHRSAFSDLKRLVWGSVSANLSEADREWRLYNPRLEQWNLSFLAKDTWHCQDFRNVFERCPAELDGTYYIRLKDVRYLVKYRTLSQRRVLLLFKMLWFWFVFNHFQAHLFSKDPSHNGAVILKN